MRIDERHTSELLGQSTRTMVLPSGLTVQMCRMPGFVTAYAMLTVGVGSIDIGYRVRGREVSLPAGVAHYLEHKMFDCPYGDAMQRFDALGASANAFTSFDKTAYYFSCTENFSKALEVLLDFVATPYFTGPSVRRERGIIAEELRMYRDSPEWMVTANLLQAMYHVHPIREDIAGTEESIAHIDAALLRRCYERFYCPGNMVLSVAGCFEEDAVLELAEKYFPTAKTAANPLTIREPRTVREHYCEQKMPIAAPMFQVGFKAAGGEKMSPQFIVKNMLTNKACIGMLLGIVLGALGVHKAIDGTAAGEIVASLLSFITAPTSALILIVMGYQLYVSRALLRPVLTTMGLRLGVLAVVCAAVSGILFAVIPFDKGLLLALMLQYTLPAPFIIPLFADLGDDAEYVSTTLSLGTVLAVVLFFFLAAFSLA